MSPTFHLEPIDDDDPTSAYRAIVQPGKHIDRAEFAQAILEQGLPTNVETLLALLDVEVVAVASLMNEGWDVATPEGIVLETPWPDPLLAAMLGGTVNGRATAGEEYITERMLKLGAPHTPSQIKAFFAAQEQAMVYLLQQGFLIEHPLSDVCTTIEGVFSDPHDEFDPQQHSLDIECGEGIEIADWLEGYRELERRGLGETPRPLLDGYDDIHTDLSDQSVSPGHMIRLRGYWLRFQDSDPQQGVFISAEDGSTQRVQTVLITGLCGADFVWPHDLPLGNYWLEMRSIIVPRDGLQRTMWPNPIPVVAEPRR